jgi:hypothetical protein
MHQMGKPALHVEMVQCLVQKDALALRLEGECAIIAMPFHAESAATTDQQDFHCPTITNKCHTYPLPG